MSVKITCTVCKNIYKPKKTLSCPRKDCPQMPRNPIISKNKPRYLTAEELEAGKRTPGLKVKYSEDGKNKIKYTLWEKLKSMISGD